MVFCDRNPSGHRCRSHPGVASTLCPFSGQFLRPNRRSEPHAQHQCGCAPAFCCGYGRRAIIDGYADELEIWTYPFQIVRNYQVAFRARGTTTSISGRDILSRIDYEPDSVTRVYLGPDFVVREKLFVPLNEPGAILSYEVQSKTPIDILVHAVPVLDLMWPASLGGQSVSWNGSLSAFVLAAPADGFTATVGSPDMVAHDEIVNRATHSEGVELAFTLRSSDTDVATLYVALNPRHTSDPGAIFHRLLSDRKTFEAETTNTFASSERAF